MLNLISLIKINMSSKISKEEIVDFLNGRNPEKYIVHIEASSYSQKVHLIINDPKKGKYIEKDNYLPFFWAKKEGLLKLCNGNKSKIKDLLHKSGIKIKKLKIHDDEGNTHDRLKNGFQFLVQADKPYGEIINIFKANGVDIFDPENKKDFFTVSAIEQYMIQKGKRLYKGINDYDQLHRLQFDLETKGLDPKVNRIFNIGIRDNRGFETTLEINGNTKEELRNKELLAIETFFDLIHELKPDTIAGYNSENFDFYFLIERAHQLGSNIKDISKSLNKTPLQRRKSVVKYGQETEFYEQTIMWGLPIIDIYHSVRRAQAINSNIKFADLKYITKFAKIAKPNRVYVKGDLIYDTWADTEGKYAFKEEDGDWYKITDKYPLKEEYELVEGRYVIERYLLDDLWETEHVDFSFKQADFLLSKIIPTSYPRISTMGTASIWKLIMATWSYEKGLGIPDYEEKRDFVGGLSRLIECGYAEDVAKLDYAALYPNTELTHGIFPHFDITGVMEALLLYIAETRDESKALKKKYSNRKKEIERNLIKYEKEGKLTKELKIKAEKAIKKYDKLANDYDKKQLPIKILANSFFGSFGAPYIFPWGETNSAEETTCRGRQYLRLLVKFFFEKYGFRPLVMDTDGVNFAIPKDINNLTYTGKGNHRFTEKDKKYTGLDAAVAEFNDEYMIGRMGLDVDEIASSTINFARKNYADLIDGEVKLVGNSIKSKKMETYIEEFFDVGIKMLLENKGKEFIDYYYEYVDKIYNYQIPLAKIASKGKVKQTITEYKKKCKQKNKAGNPMPRQAHMELILHHNLQVDLGSTIYYVNVGEGKTTGDIKSNKIMKKLPFKKGEIYKVNGKRAKFKIKRINYNKNKEIESFEGYFINKKDPQIEILPFDKLKPNEELTGGVDIQLNCKLIPKTQIDYDPDLTTDEYNVARYLNKFNKRIKPLLIVFHPDIRDEILIDIKKDRKTKISVLEDKKTFTKKQCKLIAGIPYKEEDQDTYEALMTMDDKEIKFWMSVDKIPNNIDLDEWEESKKDYIKRLRETKIKGLENERLRLDERFKRLEIDDIKRVRNSINNNPEDYYLWIMTELNVDLDFDDENGNHYLKSFKYVDDEYTKDIPNHLYNEDEIFKYEDLAIERENFYKENGLCKEITRKEVDPVNDGYINETTKIINENAYDKWLEFKNKSN